MLQGAEAEAMMACMSSWVRRMVEVEGPARSSSVSPEAVGLSPWVSVPGVGPSVVSRADRAASMSMAWESWFTFRPLAAGAAPKSFSMASRAEV